MEIISIKVVFASSVNLLIAYIAYKAPVTVLSVLLDLFCKQVNVSLAQSIAHPAQIISLSA